MWPFGSNWQRYLQGGYKELFTPKALPPQPPHQHDFEMNYVDKLHYKLECKCGETANNMRDALRKMGLI